MSGKKYGKKYSNIYSSSIKNPSRVSKFYILWGITSLIFSGLSFPIFGWKGILVGMFIGLIANRELFSAAITSDEEAKEILNGDRE